MRYGWDPAKAKRNLRDHGVAFEAVHGFDWDRAYEEEDDLLDYGEVRMKATGPIDDRLHVCVYTDRPYARRVISLRKATAREARIWVRATQGD